MRDIPPVEDLGAGVWSVPVPIPASPLGYTLVYVLDSAQGPVLVDAGWDDDTSWRALTAGLESAGTSVSKVRGVVLTHFHPDHAGLAGRVREVSGAWIAMHPADTDLVRRVGRDGATRRRSELDQLRRAGASDDEVATYSGSHPSLSLPALPDRELAHGELVDVSDRALRVVWTAGHSPGHVCLHLEDDNRLFTGDHVLPRITPFVGLFPADDDSDPLGVFLDSLARARDVDAIEALPGHEHRFIDIAARTAEIAEHHDDRLRELAAILTTRPATLWELCSRLSWRRGWETMDVAVRRMAASETAAHLRTLERRGEAAREAPEGGPPRWTATAVSPTRSPGN